MPRHMRPVQIHRLISCSTTSRTCLVAVFRLIPGPRTSWKPLPKQPTSKGKCLGRLPDLVFAVAIACGLDTYLDVRQLREGLQEMIVQSGVTFDVAIPQAKHIPDQRVYPSRGFAAADKTWPETPSLDPAALQDVYLPQSYVQQFPILWP